MHDLTKEQEDFQYWLFDMDDALERFFENLPNGLVMDLDFTLNSLDLLENWILNTYSSIAKIQAIEEASTVDGLVRYIGETFRKTLGGQWEIRFDDPKYIYYGLPQLAHFSSLKIAPICPMRLVTTCVARRKGHFLSTILQNQIKRIPIKTTKTISLKQPLFLVERYG
jgi:hypothetical protein